MKQILLSIAAGIMLPSCAQMIPGLTEAIDDAFTDEACQVTIDRAAIQTNADIDIAIKITKNNTHPPAPIINVHPATGGQ